MQLQINNAVFEFPKISHLISSFLKSKYPTSKAPQRKHDTLKMLCVFAAPCFFFFFQFLALFTWFYNILQYTA